MFIQISQYFDVFFKFPYSEIFRRFEDFKGRNGGDDGLKIIKPLLKYASEAIKPSGQLFMEVWPTHPEPLKAFTEEHKELKLRVDCIYKDPQNMERYVEMTRLP